MLLYGITDVQIHFEHFVKKSEGNRLGDLAGHSVDHVISYNSAAKE